MTSNDKNIEYRDDLPYSDERVAKDTDNDLDIENPEYEKQDISEISTLTRWEKFKHKAKQTWNGKTKVGRYVGLGLDVGESFLPKWIGRIRDIIQSQTKSNAMLNGKKWYKSKTIWSAIILVVIAILQGLGVDLMANPELTTTVFEVAMMLAGAFGLYGLRDAIDKQMDKFKDK